MRFISQPHTKMETRQRTAAKSHITKVLSHFVPPAITFLAERRNIPQRQIDLLEVLPDDVLPGAAWPVLKLSTVCRPESYS